MVNQTLLELFMMENDIGDDGIKAIAVSLNDSGITVLHVRSCGITFDGVSSLAKALSASQKIKALGLWDNPITVDGARLIMKSALSNPICECILIDSEYQNDDKVKEMMTFLDDRKRKVTIAIAIIKWDIFTSTNFCKTARQKFMIYSATYILVLFYSHVGIHVAKYYLGTSLFCFFHLFFFPTILF